MFGEGVCRVCGCTDENACITEAGACWWISELERDLCSACVDSSSTTDIFMNLNSKKKHITEINM